MVYSKKFVHGLQKLGRQRKHPPPPQQQPLHAPRSAMSSPPRKRKAEAIGQGLPKAPSRDASPIVLSNTSSGEQVRESMELSDHRDSEEQDSDFAPFIAGTSDDTSSGSDSGSSSGSDSGEGSPPSAPSIVASVQLGPRVQPHVGYKVHQPLPMARLVPPARRLPAASTSSAPAWLIAGGPPAAAAPAKVQPAAQRTYARPSRPAPTGTGTSTATGVEVEGGQGDGHGAGSGHAGEGGAAACDGAAVDSPPTEEDGEAAAPQDLGQLDPPRVHTPASIRAPDYQGTAAAGGGFGASRAAAAASRELIAGETAAKRHRATGESAARQLPRPAPSLRPAAAAAFTRPQHVRFTLHLRMSTCISSYGSSCFLLGRGYRIRFLHAMHLLKSCSRHLMYSYDTDHFKLREMSSEHEVGRVHP